MGGAATRIAACGHTFHLECIGEWALVDMRCPLCKAQIGCADDASTDAAILARVAAHVPFVHVPWLDDVAEPPYALEPDEDDSDAERLLACLTPHCGELVLGRHMREHYARHCAPRRCDGCGATSTAALIERHLSSHCPRRLMPCPAEGCSWVVPHSVWKAVHDDKGLSAAPAYIDGQWYASTAQCLVADHQCAHVVACGACPRVYRNAALLNAHVCASHTGSDVERALPPRRTRSAALVARRQMRTSNVVVAGGLVRNWSLV